jgi:hypothetical protein
VVAVVRGVVIVAERLERLRPFRVVARQLDRGLVERDRGLDRESLPGRRAGDEEGGAAAGSGIGEG